MYVCMFKKFMSMTLVLVMALSIVGCVSTEPNVTELTENTEVTNPGGDTGGVDPGTTEPEASIPDVSIPDVSEPDVPVHQHSYVENVTKATCIKDGYTTYTCACGDSYVDGKIEATGHSWSDWVTIEEPTVTATGMAGRNCTACGEAETKVLDKVIPDHTHSYTGKVTTAATCTKEGVKTFTCSCGSSYTESIAKASHSYKATVTAPTCTAKGYTTHKCSACNNSYKDTYVAATGHSYGSYKSNGDATCTKDGTKTAKCTACSVTNTVTDTGSATGHGYGSYTSNGNATCTADGTKTATCSKCGSKDTVTDAGTAKGHSYAASVTAPTCTAQGYTLHKCSACGDSYKDSYVPVKPHDYAVTAIEEATMWWEGYTTYTCNHCGDSYDGDRVEKIPQKEFERMVAEAVVKYINQYRQEQGDTEAISLPGLTLVAEYRAVQLQEKFDHSITDLREAYAHYDYGDWVDMTKYGYPGYYTANAKEAIAARSIYRTSPDRIGELIALQFRNSKNHWTYVGSSEFSFIGVGITYNANASSGYCWHCCVLQTEKNYG